MTTRQVEKNTGSSASVVLVVDGERNQLETIGRGLFLTGHEAVCFARREDALALLESSIGSVVQGLVTDIARDGSHGHMALLESARRIRGDLRLVAIVDERCPDEAAKLRELGVVVIYKPFSVFELGDAIERALELHEGEAEKKN